MSYTKQGFKSGDKLYAVDLNEMDEQIYLNDQEITELKDAFAEHEEHPVNNNLLINSNFANPVNQRGVTASTWTVDYGIDRWEVYNATFTSLENGVSFTPKNNAQGGVYQHVEFKTLPSKPVSVSACINGTVYRGNGTKLLSSKTDEVFTFNDIVLGVVSSFFSTQYQYIDVYVYGTDSSKTYNIEWVKAEFGDHATPYVLRLYAEELELCRRYYQRLNINSGRTGVALITDDNIYFWIELSKMRTSPTMDASGMNLFANGNVIAGFSFSINSYSNGCESNTAVQIIANKTGHGFNYTHNLGLQNTLIFDAEL